MRLYVNIDHVATVREARRTDEPDPVRAAAAAERGGADGITVHLREDRRHIQDADVRALRAAVRNVLNLELGAAPEIVRIAGRLKRLQARSEEHTSELQSRLHLVCRLLLEKKKHKQLRTHSGADHPTSATMPAQC